MKRRRIYLDHLSATPLLPAAREAMEPFLGEAFANPANMHAEGVRALEAVETARRRFVELLQAEEPGEIIFTSGATEAANLAIKGAAWAHGKKGKHIVLSAAEHPSLDGSVAFLESQGYEATRVGVDGEGFIDPEEIRKAIRPDTILVATHLGNYDSGALQDAAAIGRVAKECGIPFFCDASTVGGWLPVDVRELNADLVSLSPSRFFGPKGTGVLYCRRGLELVPMVHGGRQEFGFRAGMPNVAGIVGAGVAAREAMGEQSERSRMAAERRDHLWKRCAEEIGHARLNGPAAGPRRDPRHLNISFEETEGEALMLLLDIRGLAVSSATGCVSGDSKYSHVLQAMGVPTGLVKAAILMGVSHDQLLEEIDAAFEEVKGAVEKMRAMSQGWKDILAGKKQPLA